MPRRDFRSSCSHCILLQVPDSEVDAIKKAVSGVWGARMRARHKYPCIAEKVGAESPAEEKCLDRHR